IVVDDADDAVAVIQNTCFGVWPVCFRSDPLIPVVVRVCGVLLFDRLQPRILPRWLVEVTVNANVFVHAGQVSLWSRSTALCGAIRMPLPTPGRSAAGCNIPGSAVSRA